MPNNQQNSPIDSTATNRPVSPINGCPVPVGQPFVAGDSRPAEAQKKAVAARKARKTLREELINLLSAEITDKKGRTVQAQTAMSNAILREALGGNTKAFEIIRDTIGEKPAENIQVSIPDSNILDEISARMGADAE